MFRLLRFRMVESVAATVDDLFDGEQSDQDSGNRNGCVKRSNRCVRRQAKAAEAAQVIQIAIINQAGGHHEHDQTNDQLSYQPWLAVHRFRDGSEIEMV